MFIGMHGGQIERSPEGDFRMTINLDNLESVAKRCLPDENHTYYVKCYADVVIKLITIARTSQSILSHIDHGDGDWVTIVGELRKALEEIQ